MTVRGFKRHKNDNKGDVEVMNARRNVNKFFEFEENKSKKQQKNT